MSHFTIPLLILAVGGLGYWHLSDVLMVFMTDQSQIIDLSSLVQDQPERAESCGAGYLLESYISQNEAIVKIQAGVNKLLISCVFILFFASALREASLFYASNKNT